MFRSGELSKRYRILFITSQTNWPQLDGLTLRQLPIVRALASMGDLDILCRQNPDTHCIPTPWLSLAQRVITQPDDVGILNAPPGAINGPLTRLFCRRGGYPEKPLTESMLLPEVREMLHDARRDRFLANVEVQGARYFAVFHHLSGIFFKATDSNHFQVQFL